MQSQFILYSQKIGLYKNDQSDYWLLINVYSISGNKYAKEEVANVREKN
jgi:hypothetical protein